MNYVTLQVIPENKTKSKPSSAAENVLSIIGVVVLLIFVGMLIDEKGREKLRQGAIFVICLLPLTAVFLFLANATLGLIVGAIAVVGIVIINIKKK
jgi:hypothetical protein